MLITNKSEAKRKYGSNHKCKVVKGTVVNVDNVCGKGKSRTSCFIVFDWRLDNATVKRKKVNLRSVKLCEIGTPPPDHVSLFHHSTTPLSPPVLSLDLKSPSTSTTTDKEKDKQRCPENVDNDV